MPNPNYIIMQIFFFYFILFCLSTYLFLKTINFYLNGKGNNFIILICLRESFPNIEN
ncbi:unnamed protein product [Meloidogyne enterolobii]|uniref:Uncharacterized protein n=1 Tax=Meloidogyne enterolobii TaxID=390850 RepID=A0ACB0ZQW5_MELEN